MKKVEFYAFKNVIKFTHSIRTRKDIIELILNIITKENLHIPKNKEDISIIFYVDKMLRVFIYENIDKIHSFSIPFLIKENNFEIGKEEKKFVFFNKNYIKITDEAISFLKAVFLKINIDRPKFTDRIEYIFYEMLEEYNINDVELINNYFELIIDLLSFEPAYVRYDHDITNIKQNHPEYHLDFNYSQGATFKIGLQKNLSIQEFIDVLDIKSKNLLFIGPTNNKKRSTRKL